MAGADRIAEWQQSITEIRDSEDHPDDPPLVAQLYVSCSDFFRDIIAGLSGNASVDKSVLITLQRSQSYMVLWADGYGVSDGLLDKSLDKSRRARAATLRLIFSVSQTLTKRLALHAPQEQLVSLSTDITKIGLVADKVKFLIEHDDTGDSDSDASSDSSSQADAADLGEIAEDLLTDTQCLMDLGSRFQEEHVGPVNLESAVSAARLGTWEPSMNFVDRVRWRYPRCESSLAERLGKANWARVLRHRDTVSENSRTELAMATSAASQVASTTFRDSALGSSAPSGAPVSGHATTDYAETLFSYRAGQGDSIRVPPLPDGAREGKPFSCVGCGMKVQLKTKSAWKKHLFLDIQPYICLDNGCDLNSSPFPTKAQWEDHVNLEHGLSQSTTTTSECPICQEETPNWQANAKIHLAQHLEEIALTVLPTNLDSEDGTDLDSRLASSETTATDSLVSVGRQDPVQPDSYKPSPAGNRDQVLEAAKRAQAEGEEKARQVLGPLFTSPTVTFLLPHAARMKEGDWKTVERCLNRDPRARDDLTLLSRLLTEEGNKARQNDQTQTPQQQPKGASPGVTQTTPNAAAANLPLEGAPVTDVLGPKIWTGVGFLPRFVRQAEVPGEGPCYFYDDGTHCQTVIDGEPVNAHWGVTKAGKPRKRLSIACLTCREKKIKCDPDYPRCVQCEKFGRTCRFKNAPRGGHEMSVTPEVEGPPAMPLSNDPLQNLRAANHQHLSVPSSSSSCIPIQHGSPPAPSIDDSIHTALQQPSGNPQDNKLLLPDDVPDISNSQYQQAKNRPWKCPILTCKYHEYGWPTEKEMNRHVNDKHSSTPAIHECLYESCDYKSKRESNCKQHMEKEHGWKPGTPGQPKASHHVD